MPAGLKKRHFTLEELGLVLAIGLKHLRLMLLVASLFLIMGLFYAVYARPVYHARSMITAQLTGRMMDTQAVFHDSSVRYLRSTLVSPALLVRTAHRVGIRTTYEHIYRDCLAKIKAMPGGGSAIELRIWAYDHNTVAKWAEATVEEFRELREERRRRRRDYEIESHTQDMARARERMEQYVDETETFMRESNLSAARLELAEVAHVPSRLRSVASQLRSAEWVRDELNRNPQWSTAERFSFIEKRISVSPRTLVGRTTELALAAPQPETAASPEEDAPAALVIIPSAVSGGHNWQTLLAQREAALRKFDAVKKTYRPAHRSYREAEREFETANGRLDSAYGAFENRLLFQIEHLSQEKESLEEQLPVYQKRKSAYGRLMRDFSRFRAGRLNLNGTYARLARRLETLDFGAKHETMHVEFGGHRLINHPEKPASPNRIKLAMMTLLAGLVVGVGAAFGTEYLTHTISMIEQVEENLGVPGLGVVPELAVGKGDRPFLVTDTDHSQREVFRVIRTNLLLDQSLPEERKVILVTSSMPKEGKSMTAANLAVSFAQLGQKVLLIDADFHQGHQHRTFGVPSSPGLGGVLEGEVSSLQACQPSSVPNLDVMAKDRKGRSVPELLSRPIFGETMQELRARYDRIIIDSPPVLGLSETCVLAPHADGVVFMLWSSRTPVSQIQTALKMLAANGAQVFGCVLNRLDLGIATNYYYYYYYSDYYYHSYHRLPEGQDSVEATRV